MHIAGDESMSFETAQEQATPTVTVTVMAEVGRAMEVYRNRRDFMRKYMREYRQGKRRTKDAKE